MLHDAVRRHGPQPMFGTRRDGVWHWESYRAFGALVARVRAGLAARGLEAGDRIGLLSENRIEWAACAYAAYDLGAVVVPLYGSHPPRDWAAIAEDAQLTMVVVDARARAAIDTIAAATPTLEHVIALDAPASDTDAFVRLAETSPTVPVQAPLPGATACILYTSGTGGAPKGVVLTHAALCANVAGLTRRMPLGRGDRCLSFLPWAHAFGHTCDLHAMVSIGGSVALATSPTRIFKELREVQPTVLMTVPRTLGRMREAVERSLRHKPQRLQDLFRTGLELAGRTDLGWGDRARLEAAERLLFRPARMRLGGRLRYVFCGGAALAPATARVIEAMGVAVCEGYGLTETGPVVTAHSPATRHLGSVGTPLDGVRVTIDMEAIDEPGRGEIVVHTPARMTAYHQRPEATAEALTDDGALRTGDVGYLDDRGRLVITGRIKEQYKLSTGKYVAPSPLEASLVRSEYVEQAMMYGDGRDHNVALVVVNLDALSRWAERRDLHFPDTAALLESTRVNDLILAEVGELSQDFRHHERIRSVSLIAEPFTPENGLLTPTLKIRRQRVWDKWGPLLEEHYPS